MKRVCVTFLGFVSTVLLALTADDPVKAYLDAFSPLGGDNRIFSDDRLLRLDLDLNNDGRREVLLSMARDRNGKQGNVWSVFANTGAGFTQVGGITVSPTGFYLGAIDETNGYGIVSFWPAGGGTGRYGAYSFDGSKINETQLGAIDRNPQTLQLAGNGIEIAAKYSMSVPDALREQGERFRREHGIKMPDPAAFVTQVDTIGASDLSEQYGVKIEAKTYEQALAESWSSHGPQSVPATPRASGTPQTASPSVTATENPISAPSASASAPSAASRESTSPGWSGVALWITGIIGLLAIVAFVF